MGLEQIVMCIIALVICVLFWVFEETEVYHKNIYPEQKEISLYNKKVIAVHEAGHAVMAYLKDIFDYNVNMSYPNPHVTIEQKQYEKDDVKDKILIYYSGAIAEELLFGKFHEGCMNWDDSDFVNATKLIKYYILITNSEISKSLLDIEISEEIISLSKKLYKEAYEIMKVNRNKVERLAERLMVTDNLNKNEIRLIMEETYE